MTFLDDGGRQALKAAVQAVEARSSAELVVAVRPQAGSYAAVDLAWASMAGVATLAYVLFSPTEVPTMGLFVAPLVIGGLAWALSCSTPFLRRALMPRAKRNLRVHEAAAAQFHERRVHQTTGRTGILVHVCLLEKTCEVVADIGVVEAVEEERWEADVASLRRSLAAGADATGFARVLERLGDTLEPALPHSDDDVNELPDEPVA